MSSWSLCLPICVPFRDGTHDTDGGYLNRPGFCRGSGGWVGDRFLAVSWAGWSVPSSSIAALWGPLSVARVFARRHFASNAAGVV